MIKNIIELSKISTTVASLICAAYIWVNLSGKEAFFFFLFAGLFIISLRAFEEDLYYNRKRRGY